MKKTHSIFIVEDHQLFREGLRSMLTSRDDVKVVGEAEDGLDGVRQISKIKPDLLLLDLSMPKMGGISVMHRMVPVSVSTTIR